MINVSVTSVCIRQTLTRNWSFMDCSAFACQIRSIWVVCHTNDRMIFFYAKTASGFGMEYGFGARVVSADWPEGYY